jgi:hypothetical protein
MEEEKSCWFLAFLDAFLHDSFLVRFSRLRLWSVVFEGLGQAWEVSGLGEKATMLGKVKLKV